MVYKCLNGEPLQKWYSVDIVHIPETHTKVAYFISEIHVNRRVELNPSFSDEFRDAEILRDRDLLSRIHAKYGTDIYAK